MSARVIVTVPPYAEFLATLANDPVFKHCACGIRFNTVMQLRRDDPKRDVLARLRDIFGDLPVWVDLKTRQLRAAEFCVPPFAGIRLTHKIKVQTPVTAYFKDGMEQARVVQVDGDMLIMQDGPRRVVGPGESINIPDPSLEVEGFLTEGDEQYVEASKEAGINTFMVSFVEHEDDMKSLVELVPNARFLLKIESVRGMSFVKRRGHKSVPKARLMAARGDLFTELDMPHQIAAATRDIIRNDARAVVASRFFASMLNAPRPSCAEVGDMAYHLTLGYRTFMLGDEICQSERPLLSALRAFDAMARQFAR